MTRPRLALCLGDQAGSGPETMLRTIIDPRVRVAMHHRALAIA